MTGMLRFVIVYPRDGWNHCLTLRVSSFLVIPSMVALKLIVYSPFTGSSIASWLYSLVHSSPKYLEPRIWSL
ncbi:hypothetical protein V6N13_145108 [Hibiscus sabdariffa]